MLHQETLIMYFKLILKHFPCFQFLYPKTPTFHFLSLLLEMLLPQKHIPKNTNFSLFVTPFGNAATLETHTQKHQLFTFCHSSWKCCYLRNTCNVLAHISSECFINSLNPTPSHTICWQSVFDQFVGLALKGLIIAFLNASVDVSRLILYVFAIWCSSISISHFNFVAFAFFCFLIAFLFQIVSTKRKIALFSQSWCDCKVVHRTPITF